VGRHDRYHLWFGVGASFVPRSNACYLRLLEFTRVLDAVQRRDDQIRQEQEDITAILFEEQSPIAGTR